MNKTLLEEILELKKSFENEIYFYEYTSKKRLLRVKIDYVSELKLHEAMKMLVREKINKSEYENYKQKVEESKKIYKELLCTV